MLLVLLIVFFVKRRPSVKEHSRNFVFFPVYISEFGRHVLGPRTSLAYVGP